MKKLFAYIAAMSLAGSATAASIGFDFGTNFYRPSAAGYTTENGQNFAISWNLDNDLSLGIYTEESIFDGGGASNAGDLSITAIQVTKGVMRNVAVGLNLGSAESDIGVTSDRGTLVDVFGVVNILSGSGEKVSGALRATASARFSNVSLDTVVANDPGGDGVNLGLSVQIAF